MKLQITNESDESNDSMSVCLSASSIPFKFLKKLKWNFYRKKNS